MTLQIDGVVPVLPTPFDSDEAIDVGSLRRVVEFVAEQRVAAMCLPAYGSEFYKLSDTEREHVVGVAIEANRGRIPVIAQANHHAAAVAASQAVRYAQMGADAISIALPRQFSGTDDDLLDFVSRVAEAVDLPILVQDFNPAGATIDVAFIREANRRHPHVRLFKLEEPMSLDKLVRIRDAVGESVSILSGWGGLFMLEALSVPRGIRGVMPGVALCDIFQRIYEDYRAGHREVAYRTFAILSPWIGFSLQHFELFLHMEKMVLIRRRLIDYDRRRSATRQFSPQMQAYLDFMLEQIQPLFKSGISVRADC